MPTVTMDRDDLFGILGKAVDMDRLLSDLTSLKCEVQAVEGDEITVEVTPDRPDLFSTEGIAVALKGLEGFEVGPPKIRVQRGVVTATIDKSVKGVRPCVAFSEVLGLRLSNEAVRQIMQLQEKLHETYCRHRRKVSIGIHDKDAITPRINYLALKPDEIRFVPLGETREMSGSEILDLTPKGVQYGHIIRPFDRYPLLVDDEGTVLSMPPIINSIHTVVTESTRNIFVDVTGTDKKLVDNVLSIMTLALLQRGRQVRNVRVKDSGRVYHTPDLSPAEMELSRDYVNQITGLSMSAREIKGLLQRMRLGVKLVDSDRLRVLVPAYRSDVLHEIDLVEDVLMVYGYDNVEPEYPSIATIGRESADAEAIRRVRDLMVGFGFQEVLNYMMSNEEVLFTRMRLSPEKIVRVANPVSQTYSTLRNWLLPCLLNFLSFNKHAPFPQKIFECGDVVTVDGREETGTRSVVKLAAAISDSKVSYEGVQAIIYSLLPSLGVKKWTLKPIRHRSFLKGRGAGIVVRNSELGVLGEIHPEVLTNFQLDMPVAAFEVDLSQVSGLGAWR
ncbi:MAG: phenylalanine--tRNA ligase subunit beta [Candidatus Bathyarchaeia archaeon]